MWQAYLKIQAIGIIQTSVFPMKYIHRYRDLYRQLSQILDNVGLGRLKITPQQVRFYFYYQEKWNLIDDWQKFVLNRDSIIIDISKPKPIYRLVDMKRDKVLSESTDKEEIYKLYQKIAPFLRRGVLIKRDETILDVLDLPIYHYNACVNRMVQKWNY